MHLTYFIVEINIRPVQKNLNLIQICFQNVAFNYLINVMQLRIIYEVLNLVVNRASGNLLLNLYFRLIGRHQLGEAEECIFLLLF